MSKILKKTIGIFIFLLGVFFIFNNDIVKADTVITSEMRQHFADPNNMLAYEVDYDEAENKYRLKHNNGNKGWYNSHDTMQDLLDSLNASAGSYISGDTWDIHIKFMETVPLNETITIRTRIEWPSYKKANFYITSATGGVIFDVTQTTGQYQDMFSAYNMIETSNASIIVNSTNAGNATCLEISIIFSIKLSSLKL